MQVKIHFHCNLEVLDKVVKVNPKAEVYFALGKAYEGLDNVPKALQAYREAVRKGPKSELARAAVVRLERSRGRD